MLFSNSSRSGHFSRVIVLLLVVIISTRCAPSTSSIEILQPVRENLSKYQVVAVDVPPQSDDVRNITYADKISGSIVSKLRQQGKFKKVYSKNKTLKKDFDLIVSVTPSDQYYADIAQGLVGALAGRSQMTVKVTLIDGRTGTTIGSSIIKGEAASKTTIFTSSSMAQAIERISEKVSEYLSKNI